MVRALLSITVIIGMVALASAAFLSLGEPATASHAGGADAFSIDMDPSGSPANTGSSVGSIESCARVNENDTLDADEDAVDTLNVDVVIVNIPESDPAGGTSFRVLYPFPNELTVTQTSLPYAIAHG